MKTSLTLPHRSTLPSTVLLLLLAATALSPQEPTEEPPTERFGETLDVQVVNVDVYVTDKQGNPVTGLTPEDFRLYEDGRRVKITNFYAVSDSAAPAESATAAREDEGSVPTNAADAAPSPEQEDRSPADTRAADRPGTSPQPTPDEQQLQLVVYIDNVNIAPLNRNRVFDELRQFLYEYVRPGDRVMLLSYDRSLHVRQPFTGDAQAVARALLDLETLAGQATSNASRHEDLLREIERADRAAEVSGQVRQYAQSVRNDLRFTLDALREAANWLAGLDGRKMLLYVSDGLPMAPGRDLFYALQYKFEYNAAMSQVMQFDQTRSFRELTNLANANRVTFYTVDAKGLTLPGGYSAEYRGGAQESDWRPAVFDLRQDNLQNSIRAMAERTGGRAIVNTNDIGPGLRRIAQDINNYYSLGYRPAHAGDGRYHEIQVEVLRKGVEVRHREGYRDKPLTARVAEAMEADLRFGTGENPLGLRLVVGEPAPRQEGHMLLPVSVKIPLGKLTLIPRDDVWIGRAQVYFRTLDPKGRLSDTNSGELDVQISSEEYESALRQNWSYEVQLIVRPGRQRLAVAVRDQLGAQTSLIGRTFQVGS